MSDDTIPSKAAPPAPSRRRFIALAAVTIALTCALAYLWARVLIGGMLHWDRQVWPEWKHVRWLVAVTVATMLLSGYTARYALSRRALRRLCAGVAVVWFLGNAALIAYASTTTSPRWALSPVFAMSSMAILWCGWLPAWPLSWLARVLVLIVLAVLAAAFPALFNTQSLTGSFEPNFVWRHGAVHNPADVDSDQETLDEAHKLSLVATDHDYPEYLGGPERRAAAVKMNLADWKDQPPEELWRIPIGPGWSSFAVVGDYAFTQDQGGPKEQVTCYRLNDGKRMWRHTDEARFSSNEGGDGPRATPTVVQEDVGGNQVWRIYALGATGILNCLDAATGRRIWSVNVLDDNHAGNLNYGISASPLVYDRFVVCPTGKGGPSLVAYDRKTGQRLWQEGTCEPSYSSPFVAEIAGVKQVLLFAATGVQGHDAATGKVLWSFAWTNTEKINASQPIANAGGNDGEVFVSTGYGGGAALFNVKRDSEGRWSTDLLWEQPTLMRTRFTSPVILEPPHSSGPIVLGLDEGILECLDLASGKKFWKEGRYRYGQVLSCGDLLVVQSEPGAVHLVQADKAQLRGRGMIHALEDKTWNNPALAGRYLLIRNDKEAACYKLPLEEN